MRALKTWLVISVVIVFAAGVSLGWLLAARRGHDVPAIAGGEPSTSPGFWALWVATSEDFWNELALDDSEKAELEKRVVPRREELADLRARLEELARETSDDVLAALRESDRELAAELLADYTSPRPVGETLRELARLREVCGGLELHREAGVYRILFDTARQRDDLFAELRRAPEPTDDAAKRASRHEAHERVQMIYALRDDRLEKALAPEQFARHAQWVESCRQRFQGRRKDESTQGDDGRGRGGRRRDPAAPDGRVEDTPRSVPAP